MAKDFKTITISIEVYDKLREYYEKHAEELKFKHDVRSFTAFARFAINRYIEQVEEAEGMKKQD